MQLSVNMTTNVTWIIYLYWYWLIMYMNTCTDTDNACTRSPVVMYWCTDQWCTGSFTLDCYVLAESTHWQIVCFYLATVIRPTCSRSHRLHHSIQVLTEYQVVASELKDPIWHSLEWQIGSFGSEATSSAHNFTRWCNAFALHIANIWILLTKYIVIQQTQNICITFAQRRPNVFDVSPTLYNC